MKRTLILVALLAAIALATKAQPDPNFYIYLCFGQSNMEGNAQPQPFDRQGVDSRFRMLATTNFTSPQRTMGQWYQATPPLVSPEGGLGMADYFGRTMVAALPSEVRVGVVDVAIGGCAIEMFDKDKYQTQMTDPSNWSTQLANRFYGGNPYKRLVDMARKAQEVGVIKGILLHQGESNNTQQDWPQKVRKVYNDLLTDLGLQAADVPLLAGETLRQEYGGACWGHNAVIARLPQAIPTAHVVSSAGCQGNGKDPWHFNQMGYRIMGKRYAIEMLRTMGISPAAQDAYQWPGTLKRFYTVDRLDGASDIVTKCGKGQHIALNAVFADGHTEDVAGQTTFSSDNISIVDGLLAASDEKKGSVEATYTDFTGQTLSASFNVEVRFFPFNKQNINTNLFAEGTYDEATHTFHPGQWGQMGWEYSGGVDMSAYKYLVVKLRKPQNCAAHLNIFPQTSIWGDCYSSEDFGSKTLIAIPLQTAKLTSGNNKGKALNTKAIYVVSFWTNGTGDLVVDDMYLTNNDDFTPTDIRQPSIASQGLGTAIQPHADVYSLQGVKVGTTDNWNQLPRGIYVVGARLVRR